MVSYCLLVTLQKVVSFCLCLMFSSVDTVSYSQLIIYATEGGVGLFVFNIQFSCHAKLQSVNYATEGVVVLFVFKVQFS